VLFWDRHIRAWIAQYGVGIGVGVALREVYDAA